MRFINGSALTLQAAPPIKRNVKRPGILPATGGAALATPPRPGMTTSVSGYNLYIPPYSQQPGRTGSPAPGGIPHSASGPIPIAQHHAGGIPHSNTFHDLGLPPRQTTGGPIAGQPDYPPGRLQNAPQDDFLAGQMGSMNLGQSLGHSYQNQHPGGPPAPATVGSGHHHRHSVATGAVTQAPWSSMLPQNNQPQGHAPVQRPVSAGDVGGAWPTVDNRPNTAVPMPTRPLSAVGQPPVQSPPLQHHRPHANSLTVPGSYAQAPPVAPQRTDSYGQPHVSQYTGQSEAPRPTSPQSYYHQQQQQQQQQGYAPQQPPPPQQPAYSNPPPAQNRLSSYGNVPAQQPQAPYTPPQNNRHSSYGQYQTPPAPQPVPQSSYPPPQAQQQVYGQHQQPGQEYPPVPPPAQQLQQPQGPPPPLGTSPGTYPSHMPPQAPRPTTPSQYPPYPPPHPPTPQPPPHRDSFGSQSPPSHVPYSPPLAHQPPPQSFAAQPETHSPPPAPNASTTTGAYVPWYMQTQQQQPPVQSPPLQQVSTPAPSLHHHAHQSSISAAPPPPPRTGVGYYPSDELYAQQAQSQPNHQRPAPQPTPAPQQYQGYQQPPAPVHQSSYPPAGPQSPSRQGSYPPAAPPRPVSTAPLTSYNPPAPGPNPPAPSSVNPPAPNPLAPGSEAPWSTLQQQQQQPYYPSATPSYYGQQNNDFRPTTTAPEGWDSLNGRQRAPSPLPPTGGQTTNRDWRTYLHSIGSQGTPSSLPQPPSVENTPPAPLPPKRASGLPPLPQPPSQQGTPTRQTTNGSGEWYTPPPPSVPSSILPPGGYGASPQHQPQWR